jgi:hypothetical protein
MSGAVDSSDTSRRQCLTRLADEARSRGLQCTLTGPDGALLHVANPASGHSTMVFAMSLSPDNWSYLWSGGGSASATDPAQAAESLAASLGR